MKNKLSACWWHKAASKLLGYKVSWDQCWYTSEIFVYINTRAHSFPFILSTSCYCRFFFLLVFLCVFFFSLFGRQPWLLLQIISLFAYRSTLTINSYTQKCTNGQESGTRYGTFFVMVGFLLNAVRCIVHLPCTFYGNTTAALLYWAVLCCAIQLAFAFVVAMRSICHRFPILFSVFQLSEHSALEQKHCTMHRPKWKKQKKKMNGFMYYLFVICAPLHI